ncbi:uncharacterized protein IL334_006362 [Kwoniella shivajii]|uniref:RanBP2-type domain-containing protein n=1 Tax=Kwoniella shivajii TaxID=564305 RepID=A0ABZ1D630_9TREE|nr:hypothetical protein IL334_006362 [Kwoniella shivajii]
MSGYYGWPPPGYHPADNPNQQNPTQNSPYGHTNVVRPPPHISGLLNPQPVAGAYQIYRQLPQQQAQPEQRQQQQQQGPPPAYHPYGQTNVWTSVSPHDRHPYMYASAAPQYQAQPVARPTVHWECESCPTRRNERDGYVWCLKCGDFKRTCVVTGE